MERSPSEMGQQELLDEMLILSERRAQTFMSEQRRAQISRRMNSLLFELRYQSDEYANVIILDEHRDQPETA